MQTVSEGLNNTAPWDTDTRGLHSTFLGLPLYVCLHPSWGSQHALPMNKFYPETELNINNISCKQNPRAKSNSSQGSQLPAVYKTGCRIRLVRHSQNLFPHSTWKIKYLHFWCSKNIKQCIKTSSFHLWRLTIMHLSRGWVSQWVEGVDSGRSQWAESADSHAMCNGERPLRLHSKT